MRRMSYSSTLTDEACISPEHMQGFSPSRGASSTCLSMLSVYLVYKCLFVSSDSCSRVARIIPLPYSKLV